MAEETGLQGETSQQAAVNAQPAAPESAQAEPKYVTIEDAQRLANEAGERAFTRAQSLVDKSSNRINEQISARIEQVRDAYKLAGQELSPEQEATLRQNVVMQTLTAKPAQPDSQQATAQIPAQGYAPATAELDPITAYAIKKAEKVGGFTEADQEYKDIVRDPNMPAEEWLERVDAAVEAKASRLATQKQRNPASTIVGAGLNAGNPIDIPDSASSAWNQVEYKR